MRCCLSCLPAPWEPRCCHPHASLALLSCLQHPRHTLTPGPLHLLALCLECSTAVIQDPSLLQIFYSNVPFLWDLPSLIALSPFFALFFSLAVTSLEHTAYLFTCFMVPSRWDKRHEERDFSPQYPQHLAHTRRAIVFDKYVKTLHVCFVSPHIIKVTYYNY